MAHDLFPEFPHSRYSRRKPPVSRGLLLAGVAAAGSMGVGLGLWARPAMSERRLAIAPPAAQALSTPRRQIQIVVDDSPAPIGEPIEVLPDQLDTPAQMIDGDEAPELLAPVRPPEGLMRVEAPLPVAPMVLAPPTPKAERVLKAPKAKPVQVAQAEAKPAKAELLARSKDDDLRLAKVKPVRAKAEVQLAKAPAKALAKSRAAVELAQAKKPPKGMEGTVRKPAKSVKVEKAAVGKAKPAPRHEAAPPPLRPTGLMQVSNGSRCGQSDPGAKLVCASPTLGAADRQLSRAYSDARAAGVSDDRLQRQQQRWLATRSAAARDAPWAVRDVYLARIAELNGMAREARQGN